MGIALAAVAAWLALSIAWARLKRAKAGPSADAPRLVESLRRAPFPERLPLAARAPHTTWEGSLARDLEASTSPVDRASAIDACLAELELAFVTSRAWERVVPRVALLGGLFAASISVIRGGLVHALVAAAIGAVAAGVGAVLIRAAAAIESRQRSVADEIAQLLAGGRPARPVSRGTESGLGLDRRRGHG